MSARGPSRRGIARSDGAVSVARGAALGALALAVIVLAVILLGNGDTTTYKIRLINAGQLVKGNDVQVGGRRIGNVDEITLTENNQAELTISVQEPYAPLHEGTTALVRATSLSGIANRYVALTPGPNSADELPSGATIATDKTTSIVDLDQLFNTLNPQTRYALQQVVQGNATWYSGKAQEANDSAKYFAPALSTTDAVVKQLIKDQPALTDFLVQSSRLVTTLSERADDLTNLVSNGNATLGAIANQNASFDEALSLLPGTLRKANTTFVNLRATLDDLTVLVDASKPATKDLDTFLARLEPLATESTPVVGQLSRLFRQPGNFNDLYDAAVAFPQVAKLSGPATKNGIAALKKGQPVIDTLRPYAPELIGWFRDFGQPSAFYDANGHYARVQPMFTNFLRSGNQLIPQANSKRYDQISKGNVRRCPGAASAPPADGSAPFLAGGGQGDNDCDPGATPPGP